LALSIAAVALSFEKMSNGIYTTTASRLDEFIPDFRSLASQHHFNLPPTDITGAILRWIFMEPLPVEVSHFLPWRLLWATLADDFPFILDNHCSPTLKPTPPSSQVAVAMDTLYPPTGGRAGAKVNLTLSDVIHSGALSKTGKIMLTYLLKYGAQNDWESTSVSALLLLDTFSGQAKRVSQFLFDHPAVFSLPFTQYVKLMKGLHTGIRVFGMFPSDQQPTLSPEHQRQLYGLDTIPGRSDALQLDIPNEIAMRMKDPSIRKLPLFKGSGFEWSSEHLYDEELNISINETVKTALKRTTHLVPFSEWYRTRMHWAASGGAPGATVRWADDGPNERLNKRGALLLIPESHVRSILASALGPVLWSKASIKYENGKKRAIWNTSVEHYIIQAYILDNFDNNMANTSWNSSHHGISAKLRGDVLRLMMLDFNIGLMWDFADFNINHTFKAMMKAFSATVTCLSQRAVSKEGDPPTGLRRARTDLHNCLTWINAARECTILEDPLSGVISQVYRSLQSGERATSFCNTMMNRAYTIMVRRWAFRTMGTPLLTLLSFHQGDDVYALCTTILQALYACIAYNLLGFAGQVYKVTADYHGRAEFLRLSYDAKDCKISGYPIRSCMGLLAGEFFRESTVDPSARAASFIEQYSKVIRRGGNVSVKVLECMIRSKAALRYTDASGTKHSVVPDLQLMLTPSALGGYGICTTAAEAFGPQVILSAVPNRQMPYAVGQFTPPPSPPCFAIIPSGEGKSTLASEYPMLYVDSDYLVESQPSAARHWKKLLAKARETGSWAPVNEFRMQLVLDDCLLKPMSGVVYLLHSTSHIPSQFLTAYVGTFILVQSTGVRVNIDNRNSLKATEQVIECFGFHERNTKLFKQVINFKRLQVNLSLPTYNLPTYTRSSASQKPPQFTPPKVPMAILFKGLSSSIMDIQKAHELAGPEAANAARDIVGHSAIAGAYPGTAISDNMASFAKQLDVWLKCTVKKGQHTMISLPVPILRDATSDFTNQWTEFFTTCTVLGDNFNPPSIIVSNSFGILESLTIVAGFSSTAARDDTISRLSPRWGLGSYGKWLTLASRVPAIADSSIWQSCDSVLRRLPVSDDSLSLARITQPEMLDYFKGKLSFFPPQYFGLSSTLVSLFRAQVLSFIERSGYIFSYSGLHLYDVVYQLEIIVYQAYFNSTIVAFPVPLAYGE
jgi:hypothetical protein